MSEVKKDVCCAILESHELQVEESKLEHIPLTPAQFLESFSTLRDEFQSLRAAAEEAGLERRHIRLLLMRLRPFCCVHR